MPGTITFRPIEANLTHNTDILTKMNPYCALSVGTDVFRGQVCKKGGKHPHWNDAITVPVLNQSTAMVEVMDKDKISKDDHIGSCTIDLQEVQSMGQISKWYPLYHKNKPAGEILMEAVFQPDASYGGQSGAFAGQSSELYGQQQMRLNQQEIGMTQPTTWTQEETITGNFPQSTGFKEEVIMNEVSGLHTGTNVYTEQRQVVEPRTFMKDVEVVETRPVLKEIEVMEPHKVMKEVQVTEAVPVTKQIEVTEPQVVMKNVEVIEPRVVTKQIQVVENVPVMRQVEVIEPRTHIQEVNTFEPQTFTKQVEVTENFPVLKTVEVSEPVTIHKNVEFVEPVITTQTITKEVQQPIVVDEKITTTVGPASLVGVRTDYTQERLGERIEGIHITEEQRILEQQRLSGQQGILGQERFSGQQGLLEQERLSGQQGLLGQERLSGQQGLRGQEGFLEEEQLGRGYKPGNYHTSHKHI